MPYNTQRAVFTHVSPSATVVKPCILPIASPFEVNMIPGNPAIGAYQSEVARAGSAFYEINGLVYELCGQVDATTKSPEGGLFAAAGFAVSATPFVWTLGNPQTLGSVPAGDTVLLTTCSYNVDGLAWAGASLAADLVWTFRPSERPLLTCHLLGNIANATALGPAAVSPPAMTGSLPVPTIWGNSANTVTINAVTTHNVLEIVVATNNKLTLTPDPRYIWGFGPPAITGERKLTVAVTVEVPLKATQDFELAIGAGTQHAVGWKYVTGAGFKTTTYAAVCKLENWVDMGADSNKLVYKLLYAQDPAGAMFTFATTA